MARIIKIKGNNVNFRFVAFTGFTEIENIWRNLLSLVLQFQFTTSKCTIGTTDGYECGASDGSTVYDGAATADKRRLQRNAEQTD